MAENTTYTAAAAYVKVEIGPADGNRVARIVRRGNPIPDGVDPAKLSELEDLGLIERVTVVPEPDPAAAAAAVAAKAEADEKAKAEAAAKAEAEAKAKADAAAKAAAAKTPAK